MFNIRLMDEDGIWGSTFSKTVQILFITIYGCTDDLACNYSSQSNTDDGTCIYPPEFYNCEGECLLDEDNESELTDQRLQAWVQQITAEA